MKDQDEDGSMTELQKIGQAILAGEREPSGHSTSDSTRYCRRQFPGPSILRIMG